VHCDPPQVMQFAGLGLVYSQLSVGWRLLHEARRIAGDAGPIQEERISVQRGSRRWRGVEQGRRHEFAGLHRALWAEIVLRRHQRLLQDLHIVVFPISGVARSQNDSDLRRDQRGKTFCALATRRVHNNHNSRYRNVKHNNDKKGFNDEQSQN